MKTSNKLVFICLVSLLFCACSSSIDTNNKLAENKIVTLENSTSVINVSEESQNISDRGVLQQKVLIENLPDGNYRFCSDPNSYSIQDQPDSERYCFDFTKTGNKIIGSYLYRAPKDVPIICLEGVVEGNKVNGVGYEYTFSGSEPLTEKDFAYRDLGRNLRVI